ncbi:MAG: uracil-DNA glycosylase, partial [Methylibium sp.]|nr:uracil-DNA glycosylase [Methylibium sp.]
MVWDDRQAAMLAEMGIRVWRSPAAPAVATPVADADAPRAPSGVAEPAPAMPRAAAAERGARPGGVEAMDWADLRTAVTGCTACGLCRGRTNTVFGVGHTQAHWMVVGEAPGEQEDRQGEPFVGKAGQLLDNMLRALGLTRQADGEGLQPAQ